MLEWSILNVFPQLFEKRIKTMGRRRILMQTRIFKDTLQKFENNHTYNVISVSK